MASCPVQIRLQRPVLEAYGGQRTWSGSVRYKWPFYLAEGLEDGPSLMLMRQGDPENMCAAT